MKEVTAFDGDIINTCPEWFLNDELPHFVKWGYGSSVMSGQWSNGKVNAVKSRFTAEEQESLQALIDDTSDNNVLYVSGEKPYLLHVSTTDGSISPISSAAPARRRCNQSALEAWGSSIKSTTP